MSHKLLLLNPTHQILLNKLAEKDISVERDFKSTSSQIIEKVHQFDGIILRSRINIDQAILDAGKRLKFIAREGVGTEHIDVEYAENKGIRVLTSPEGSRDTVSEHAIGMLLMLMNKLGIADREIRKGIWEREGNRGTEIKNKTIGFLGYGNMGKAFAKKISGFEANVVAYDKYKTDYGDKYAEAVDLQTLHRESDILSIHIPYSKANHHFVDGAFLDQFHKSIYLVNTARGLVLHTADLVNRMESGKVLGAALDVLEYEEQSFDEWDFANLPVPFQYLCQSDRTVLSPHIAGWSFESKVGHARVLAEKILNLL